MTAIDDVPETPPVEAGGAGSIIGSIHAEIAAAEADAVREVRVGKIPNLYARHRVLTRAERREIEKAGRLRTRVTRNGDDDDDDKAEQNAALLLVKSCEEILYQHDDGTRQPLHEVLSLDGDEAPGPLRYNAGLIEALDQAAEASGHGLLSEQLGLKMDGERPPSSVQVVMALHRWGGDYAPLVTTARLLSMWMSGASSELLEGVLEGM